MSISCSESAEMSIAWPVHESGRGTILPLTFELCSSTCTSNLKLLYERSSSYILKRYRNEAHRILSCSVSQSNLRFLNISLFICTKLTTLSCKAHCIYLPYWMQELEEAYQPDPDWVFEASDVSVCHVRLVQKDRRKTCILTSHCIPLPTQNSHGAEGLCPGLTHCSRSDIMRIYSS